MSRHSWTRVGAVAVGMVLVATSTVWAPNGAQAGPTIPSAGTWTATGPGSVTVTSDGSSQHPEFKYDLDPAGYSVTNEWTFSAPVAVGGTISVPYSYLGNHAYFMVTVQLEAFIDYGDNNSIDVTTTLANAGPVSCCDEPSAGFFYSGSHDFSVSAGDRIGFRMSGSNYDSNNFLRGILSLDVPPYPNTTVDYVGDLVASSGSSIGLYADVTGGCRGPVDFVLDRDPVSGLAEPTNVGAGGVTSTAGWQTGSYQLSVSFAATANCVAGADLESITIVNGPVPATVTYTGQTSVTVGDYFSVGADVDPFSCPPQTLTFSLSPNPLTGESESSLELFPDGSGVVGTTGWLPGSYDLTVEYPANASCSYATDIVGFTVTGGAPYDDPDAVAQNTSWVNARLLTTAGLQDTLLAPGEARWFYFPVTPDSEVQVDLSGLDQNFDMAMYRDIGQELNSLTTKQDLYNLSAQFAPDVFSPGVFSPGVFSPGVFSPAIHLPDIYSPGVFSPGVFSPGVFSPGVFSPGVFSPGVFSPGVFSPSPEFIEAFSSAQTRSLIAISYREGTADESIRSATWGNSGNFFVRVQGRNGASSPTPFELDLAVFAGQCEGTSLLAKSEFPTISGAPGVQTVILTDSSRLGLSGQALADFEAKLEQLALATDGDVVDVSDSQRVNELNAQADDAISCPYAKNLVAESIRQIVDTYRDDQGTLKYVVIAGGDNVIPFFRYADTAGLGPESDYVPPVLGTSASEASLRRNTVLGQDAYGSQVSLSLKDGIVPVPDLAVGRLVEFPSEIVTQIDNFLGLDDGTLPTPTSSLVTGYDFLTGSSDVVQAEFAAGMAPGADLDTLITDQGVPVENTTVGGVPSRSTSWTADDLRTALFSQPHDLVYLAGHFSANSALAADYETSLITTELDEHPGLLLNSLVFSPGCHSGYNLLDADGIPGFTLGLDWAQAMARQGAVFIGGTGYQYADTDFLAYSARLYTQFAAALRTGRPGDPVAVGSALVDAKHTYLAEKSSLSGIDIKSLIQSTLFGLPMTGLDLPGRVPNPPQPVGVPTNPVLVSPGGLLGLHTGSVEVAPTTTEPSPLKPVLDLNGNPTGRYFRWLVGIDGVQTAPGLPALPQQFIDVTSEYGDVLRGVGLRYATYDDTAGTIPLTGAPATEQNGVHTSFDSPVFWPQKIYSVSYFDNVANGDQGRTRLVLTPAQYRSEPGTSPPTNTERRYTDVGLALYYSSNIETYGQNTPALAAPPSITSVVGTVAGTTVSFSANVSGDPSAGIQEVWVTYTGEAGPFHGEWQSLDLQQDATDSTLWSGSLVLPPGQEPGDVRFVVQAVNGVGLVSLDNNLGAYYTPGVLVGNVETGATPTTLELDALPAQVAHGTTVTIGAVLSGAPTGSTVYFSLGSTQLAASTDAAGHASVAVLVQNPVGNYEVSAHYGGDATFAPADDTAAIEVVKASTQVTITTAASSGPPSAFDSGVAATLTREGGASASVSAASVSTGTPIGQQTVYFIFTPSSGDPVAFARATGPDGIARLGTVRLPAGSYSLSVQFLGTVQLPSGTTTQTSATLQGATGGPVAVQVSQLATTLTYTGSTSVAVGSPLALSSTLSVAPQCQTIVTYHLDRDPLTGATGNYALGGGPTVATTGWRAGSYTITATYAGDFDCAAASAPASLSVLAPGGGAFGFGSVADPGGPVSFSFLVGNLGRSGGLFQMEQRGRWRLTSNNTRFASAGSLGLITGAGRLEWWNPNLNRGRGGWQLVGTSVPFEAPVTSSGTGIPGTFRFMFGISIGHTPTGAQPALPESSVKQLRTGVILLIPATASANQVRTAASAVRGCRSSVGRPNLAGSCRRVLSAARRPA